MLALDNIKNFLKKISSPEPLKPLNQRERRILNLGIQALLRNEEVTSFQNSWESIKDKISSNVNLRHSHWIVSIWKGFLNLMGWRISSASLFASICSIPPQTTNFRDSAFSDKDVNAALEKIYGLQGTLGFLADAEKEFLKALLKRNHSLTVTINESIELLDFFSHLNDHIVQIVQGLIRGFKAPLTHITPSDMLYAGSILDGLNPPKEIQVVVNLDPERIELESPGNIKVYQFPIVDADAEQMGMGANESERLFEQAVLEVIASLQKGLPVLVHCMEGKNRTGMVVATVLAYLLNQDIDAAFKTFMSLRGSNLGANPTPIYWSFARNTLDKMKNIDSAIEKLRSSNPELALDKRKFLEDSDLLNAILFPVSDEAFVNTCAQLIRNPGLKNS